MEKQFIFFPDKRIYQTPADAGLAFDDVYFIAQDGVRLNGWFVPYPEAHTSLLWFHGNAGNISHRVQNLKQLHDSVKVNIFIFDYRGYGRSEGEPSEQGTYLDGYAALEFLRQRYQSQPNRLILFGRSLGAAVAAKIATQVDSLILVLESPFVSVPAMARVVFPMLPIASLLSTQYNTLDKVRHIKSPLLVIHGDRDETVPFSQGKEIFDAAPEPKRFYAIAGAGHNDTYLVGGKAYFTMLREVVDWAASLQVPADQPDNTTIRP